MENTDQELESTYVKNTRIFFSLFYFLLSCNSVSAGVPNVIVGGSTHSCALSGAENNIAVCWGSNARQQRAIKVVHPYSELSSGQDYTCGLLVNGSTTCWGTYDDFVEGSAAMNLVNISLEMEELQKSLFAHISTGGAHICGLLQGSQYVKCAGWDVNGQATPHHPATKYDSVACGFMHTCAIRQDNAKVDCWGNDINGQIFPPDEEFLSIDSGKWISCGIKRSNSEVACWGENGHGQATPPVGVRFTAIAVGEEHACGILEPRFGETGAEVQCWGGETAGQHLVPAGKFVAIGAGNFHTCGKRDLDGEFDCWGYNLNGQSLAAEAPPPPPHPSPPPSPPPLPPPPLKPPGPPPPAPPLKSPPPYPSPPPISPPIPPPPKPSTNKSILDDTGAVVGIALAGVVVGICLSLIAIDQVFRRFRKRPMIIPEEIASPIKSPKAFVRSIVDSLTRSEDAHYEREMLSPKKKLDYELTSPPVRNVFGNDVLPGIC